MSFFNKKFLPVVAFIFITWATLVAIPSRADLQQVQKIIDSYCKISPDSKNNDVYSPYSKEKLSALVAMAIIEPGEEEPKFDPHDLSSVLSEQNYLLVADHYPLAELQEKAVKELGDVSVEYVDFINRPLKEHVLRTVNDDVSKLTNGKINNLFNLNTGDENTILVAANAIYLKSGWGVNSRDYDNINFMDENGQFKEQVPAFKLNASKQVRYAKKEGMYEVFGIPLENERVELQIALPVQGKTPDSLLRTPGSFSDIIATIRQANLLKQELDPTDETEKINLIIPKFLIKKKRDLSQHISGIKPWLNLAVFQDAFIKVNEKGVEAAAATSAVIKYMCIPRFINVTVDRPFAFWVIDTKTDTVLFVGKVYLPEYKE